MKKIIILLSVIMFLLIETSYISASLCQNRYGYYEECNNYEYDNSFYGYGGYPTIDKASIPMFKGSYANHRYEKYIHGDYNPYGWFSGPRYATYGYGPYFSGGYFGYWGGYYMPFSSMFWW